MLLQLKNKGKYDIGYSFSFDVASNGKDYSNVFRVMPAYSTLYPGEKPQAVSVIFNSNKEIIIQDEHILKCQVIHRYTYVYL